MDKKLTDTGTSGVNWNRGPLATIGAMLVVFVLFAVGSLIGEIGLSIIAKMTIDPAVLKESKAVVMALIGNGAYLVGSFMVIGYLKWLNKGQKVLPVIRGRWSDVSGNIGKTIGYAVLGFFAVHIISALYMLLPVPTPHVPASDMAMKMTGTAVIIFGFGAAICGPLFEETIFRGFSYNMFRSSFASRGISPAIGTALAMVLSAAFFAGMHLTLSAFVPLFIFGLVAAYIYRASGNIYAPMLMHFLFNGTASLAIALATHAI